MIDRSFWQDFATIDNSLHILSAIVGIILLVLIGLPSLYVIILNTIFWPAREIWQRWVDDKNPKIFSNPPWSRKKHLEWISPVISGFIVYAIL